MTIRERLEQQEYMLLAPNAQKAAETKGRLYPAEENEVRTCYQRDADRIVHSKSFRRLMHKTQVFLSPEGDHYRTRMTHAGGQPDCQNHLPRAAAQRRQPRLPPMGMIWGTRPSVTRGKPHLPT